MLKKTGHT